MQLLLSDHFSMTFTSAFTVLVGTAVLCLGTFVLIREHISAVGVRYWAFHASIALWLVGFGAASAALGETDAYWWFRLGIVECCSCRPRFSP